MNRTMPPRDRGNRFADSLQAPRFGGAVPRVLGLVGGIADSPERKTPPGGTRRHEGKAMKLKSSGDPVAALLVVASEGLDVQAELLDKRPGDESANGVGLPACRFHNRHERGTGGTAHQVDHVGFFAAFAGDVGRFLRGRAHRVAFCALVGGLVPLPLGGCNVGRGFRNVGNQPLDSSQIRVAATFRSLNFLTGFNLSNGATPAKLFQTSTRRFAGQEPTSLFSSRAVLKYSAVLSCAAVASSCEAKTADIVGGVDCEGAHA
jgi:hypothetical protein